MGIVIVLLLLIVVCLAVMNRRRCKKRVRTCPVAQRSYMKSAPEDVETATGDYNDYLLSTGLEKGVIESHNQFVNDIQTTTGASAQTVLSSDVYDNPFVGLRRPNMNVYIDPESRQVPTAEQWQYPTSSRYSNSGLF